MTRPVRLITLAPTESRTRASIAGNDNNRPLRAKNPYKYDMVIIKFARNAGGEVSGGNPARSPSPCRFLAFED